MSFVLQICIQKEYSCHNISKWLGNSLIIQNFKINKKKKSTILLFEIWEIREDWKTPIVKLKIVFSMVFKPRPFKELEKVVV